MGDAFVLPDKDLREVRKIASAVGFKSEQEFVVTAVEEKILAFKKLLFNTLASEVRLGLKKKGVKPEEILSGFER